MRDSKLVVVSAQSLTMIDDRNFVNFLRFFQVMGRQN